MSPHNSITGLCGILRFEILPLSMVSVPGVHILVRGKKGSGKTQLIETIKQRSKCLPYVITFYESDGSIGSLNLEGESLIGKCHAIVTASVENETEFKATYDSNLSKTLEGGSIADSDKCSRWVEFIQHVVSSIGSR